MLSRYTHADTKHQSPTVGAQILTVRSSVDGGPPKQLYTGLRLPATHGLKIEEIDATKLPNGFDVVEAASFPLSEKVVSTDQRTFGDVFRQQRNVRQLELPKTTKSTHSPTLKFSKLPNLPDPANKEDYRVAALSAGSWLEYTKADTNLAHPPDHSLKLSQRDAESLFNASFSSFAPAEDNTTAIVPRLTRARLWYRKHGDESLRRIWPSAEQLHDESGSEYPEIDDDFQQIIDNYTPVTLEDAQDL